MNKKEHLEISSR